MAKALLSHVSGSHEYAGQLHRWLVGEGHAAFLDQPGVDHPLLRSAQYADLTVDPTGERAALVVVLGRVDPDGGWGRPDDRSLFPGRRPCDVEDHWVGYDTEIGP